MAEININLLPPETIAERKVQRRRSLTLLAGVLVLVVFISVYVGLVVTTLLARTEAAGLRAEREALERKAAAYQRYADMQQRIARTETLAEQAVGSPPDWAWILAGLGVNIPPNVWLTDFVATCETPATPPAVPGPTPAPAAAPALVTREVVIRGWTFDHPSVARWIEDIHDVPGLTDIRCQFSSEEDFHGKGMVRFEIKATVLPGPAFRLQTGRGDE
ncbi:MAG: hypothetical protein QME76_02535 [Bacillota bacterium]|nr:hypothetical protein [Bacillota bacterium]